MLGSSFIANILRIMFAKCSKGFWKEKIYIYIYQYLKTKKKKKSGGVFTYFCELRLQPYIIMVYKKYNEGSLPIILKIQRV